MYQKFDSHCLVEFDESCPRPTAKREYTQGSLALVQHQIKEKENYELKKLLRFFNKIFTSPANKKYKRLHFADSSLLLESTLNMTEKYHPKEAAKMWLHRIRIITNFPLP